MYWAIPVKFHRIRNGFLLIVSYLLYMNWKPSFALVLLGITIICYLGGYIVEKKENTNRKKVFCCFFALLGLLPLLIFKYYNFLNNSIASGLDFIGLHFSLPGLNWAIPIGISFFTFQAVGYLLDVYHRRIPAEKNFWDFALFVSFFPQVVSGPISKASELLPQIKHSHTFQYEQGRDGLKMLLWGMFLKCVVADRLGMYVDTVFSSYIYFSGLNCFIASIFYSIQIYGDFSGYSFMAVGIAKIIGFDLVNNFERPYFASSITEFWKRWHISLTRWLTTHVYINLGGNRCSKLRQYINIMITFLASGLWHGANWTFILWGALHGLFQIVEKGLGIDPKGKNYNIVDKAIWKPVRVCFTFLLVNFIWIFFRAPSVPDAIGLLGKIFTSFSGQAVLYKASNSDKLFMFIAIIILFMAEIYQEYFHNKRLVWNNRIVRWVVYVCLFCMILCMGVLDASSFIYVSF